MTALSIVYAGAYFFDDFFKATDRDANHDSLGRFDGFDEVVCCFNAQLLCEFGSFSFFLSARITLSPFSLQNFANQTPIFPAPRTAVFISKPRLFCPVQL